MIYPMATEGQLSSLDVFWDHEVLELQAIHPTSDVRRLLDQDILTLRCGMYVSRDIYNQGLAADGRIAVDLNSKIEMAREILTLRAKYQTLDRRRRATLKVGHASETIQAQFEMGTI